MRHRGLYRRSFSLAFAGLAMAVLQAQAPAGPQGAGPAAGGRGGAPAVPARIDLATAHKAIEAAEAAATAASARVSIAVVDANGDLVEFRRMDGSTGNAVTSAQGKARTSVMFGLPSKAVADAAAAGTPLSASLIVATPAQQAMQVQQGGIPIVKDGKVAGAIGVGGSTPQNDEMFAKAGADAVK